MILNRNSGFVALINQLVVAGANVKTLSAFGNTLIHFVCDSESRFSDAGRAEAIRILAKAGANVQAKNRFGNTAIYFAVEYGRS